jgi:hypothetical protein
VALGSMSPHSIRQGVFHAQAPKLRQVAWLDKFKHVPIDKYDNSSNHEEFI